MWSLWLPLATITGKITQRHPIKRSQDYVDGKFSVSLGRSSPHPFQSSYLRPQYHGARMSHPLPCHLTHRTIKDDDDDDNNDNNNNNMFLSQCSGVVCDAGLVRIWFLKYNIAVIKIQSICHWLWDQVVEQIWRVLRILLVEAGNNLEEATGKGLKESKEMGILVMQWRKV